MSGLPGRDSSWGKFVRYSTHQGMFHLPVIDRFLFPNDPIVNEPGDVSSQTASEGGERNIIYGRVRPVGGNLIHCQKPVLRWQVSTRSGGKGHEETDEYNQHIYRTYAIGICEGPITGIIRVWRNEKLVYDARGNAWGRRNNGVFLRQYRMYLGGWDQQPNPALESIWGAGNVPAYRGTAYIVAVNEDLTELGGAVPQFTFEVERAEGTYLTSKPYVAEFDDAASASFSLESGTLAKMAEEYTDWPIEQAGAEFSLKGGAFRTLRREYTDWPAEQASAEFSLKGGELRRVRKLYSDWPADKAWAEFSLKSGSKRAALVKYTNWPADKTGAEFSLKGGVFTRG